jgi:ribosomal protein S12 methylthiotransferase
MRKVHITSLGCAKNLVDSEVLAGQLKLRDYELTHNPSDAELIVINTCGFIEDAKEESIQAIFEATELKKSDRGKKIFVTGCLSQRYKDQLTAEIPAIDAIFGTEDYENILYTLGENSYHPEDIYKIRELKTPNHFAYLKISEGCNHSCAFCAIPGIRGKHRSRKIEDILSEARVLAEKGVKELILVSQDTSYYGKDIYNKTKIVDLISKIADEDLFKWIRPLYWYPSNFPREYIQLMNTYDAVVPYLDMPVQHASNRVLAMMRRAEKKENLLELYSYIRQIRSDIALRTTFIVGHPGESEDDFEQLLEFVQTVRFDRVGAFLYSDEEGTPAYDLHPKVDKETAQKRYERLMTVQAKISAEKNHRFIDSIQKVLIDGYDNDQKYYYGRTSRDAPEIDNDVIISSSDYKEKFIGTFVNIRISDVSEYELYGQFVVCL